MALRADTARHFITGATVLIFSAAAIGTAMKYQNPSPASDLPLSAELPAPEASAAAHLTPSGPMSYRDGTRGAGSDIGAKLDGTVALNGRDGGVWQNRDGRRSSGNPGGAAWWAGTSARMTPTSNRSSSGGGGGSTSMGGSGYAVSGGARADKAATPPSGRANGNSRGSGGGNGGGSNGGGGSAAAPPVFGDHTGSVGDLVGGSPVELGDGVGNPGGGFDPGGLAHSPEPASLLLMATGVLGVLGAARRRRR